MRIQSISQLSGFTWENFQLLSADNISAYVEIAYPNNENDTGYESYKFPINKFFNYVMTQLMQAQQQIYEKVDKTCKDLSDWNIDAINGLSNTTDSRLKYYVYAEVNDYTSRIHNDNGIQTVIGQKTFSNPILMNSTLEVNGATTINSGINIEGLAEIGGHLKVGNGAEINSNLIVEEKLDVGGDTTIGSSTSGKNSKLNVYGNIGEVIQINCSYLRASDTVLSDKNMTTSNLTATTVPAELVARHAWWG